MGLARVDLRPSGPGDLADINVAMPVAGEPVRRQELPQRSAGRGVAKPPDQLALVVDDADPGPEIGDVAADRGGRTDFTDIANRPVTVGHVHAAWPVQVFPLRFELAVAVEDLDPVVFAVGDIDPAIRVAADVVDDVELALAGAGRAPRHE